MFYNRLIPALTLALLGGAWASPVLAQTVLDTFGPNSTTGSGATASISNTPLGSSWADVRFTAPIGGPVQTVTFAAHSILPPQFIVTADPLIVISADNAGAPGDVLETIPAPPTTVGATPVIVTVSSFSHPMLIAGTAYWVGLRSGPSSVYLGWSPGAAALVGSPTWRTCSTGISGSSCTVRGDTPPAVQITVEPPGACCARDNNCMLMSASQCASFSGRFRGQGSTCADPCPLFFPQGACCMSDGSCSLTDSYTCSVFGTRFLGEGVACATITGASACCPADFNNSGAATIADIFAFISTWFRGCP